MCKDKCCSGFLNVHGHTEKSNPRLLDSTIKIDKLIETAIELGHKGITITDHETVSAHVEAIRIMKDLRKNNAIPKDFKLILGNEIYLVDDVQYIKDNWTKESFKYYHYLLLAKNEEGHLALRKLSSEAWKNSFMTGLMERVPTQKDYLEQIVKEYPNTLISSSACLGSELSQHILNQEYDKAKEFINWNINLFGKEDFYLELQPATYEEQIQVNKKLVEYSKEFDLKLIITNDSHYLRPEDAPIHEAFLSSKEGDREVKDFYAHTYLHTIEEMYEKMDYLSDDIIKTALENTVEIYNKCVEYDLQKQTVIPKTKLPEFKLEHIFRPFYNEYEYINLMSNSEHEQDKYLMHLIEEGFKRHIPAKTLDKELLMSYINRINLELGELWKLSESLKQRMSSYYVTVAKIAELIWAVDDCDGGLSEGSLLGSGRGSAGAFFINYLIDITQVNPLSYGIEIPHWRHLSAEMGDISSLDIDLDINGFKKKYLFERIKKEFGEENFLQVCTFGTLGARGAIKTACRGLGIPSDIADHMSNLVPTERGKDWTIQECIYGHTDEDDPNKNKKPVTELINTLDKHELLKETALYVGGLTISKSVHAGGVIIFNNGAVEQNAIMKSKTGLVTQFNLDDSQYLGGIKYDILTIEALSKMQETIYYLLKDGVIEWQGTLKATFEKYFHPEVIDKEGKELFELASTGQILDLFQMSTDVGYQAITQATPNNFIELTAINSIMRLSSRQGETPLQVFTKYKNNIQLWYDEMAEYDLSQKDIELLEGYLLKISGIADTQEVAMLLSMDKDIASFTLAEATKLRKTIAGSTEKTIRELKNLFYKKGELSGASTNLLDYIWELQITPMLGYSFSIVHTLAYSLIAMIQLNMNHYYNPLYWQSAVLSVNSGTADIDSNKKDYGKVAKAIGELQKHGVKVSQPLINTAEDKFVPDIQNDRIIFALKGIRGINKETVDIILENRPFKSFEDFMERIVDKKLITNVPTLSLIKAGVFSDFEPPIESMKKYIYSITEFKDKLDGKNYKRLIKMGMLDSKELFPFKELIDFRSNLKAFTITGERGKFYRFTKEKDKEFLLTKFGYDVIFRDEGDSLLVKEGEFTKTYKEKIEKLNEIINSEEFLSSFNKKLFLENWVNSALGTKEQWEMETLVYYTDKHELEDISYLRYGLSNFFSLPEVPISKGKNKRGYDIYEIKHIVGTVIDNNSKKHTVTLLTREGVVTFKTYGGAFAHYHQKIDMSDYKEESWFTRGTKLMVSGYRRGDMFYLRAEYGQHTIAKIAEIKKDGELRLQTERGIM